MVMFAKVLLKTNVLRHGAEERKPAPLSGGRRSVMSQNGRVIGIRHRVKRTAEGEARPTQVVILAGDEKKVLELEDENAELDFVLGRLPVAYKALADDEEVGDNVLPRHWKLKRTAEGDDVPENKLLVVDGEKFVITGVPSAYEGLVPGDTVAMVLGGSGDNLAFALSRRAEEIGATVLRIPSFELKARRKEAEKDVDAELLATLAMKNPELFYEATPRDRTLIKIRETFAARMEAMKERIACEQRLRTILVGKVFRSEEGLYPQGTIEELFAKEKANDIILQALEKEEKKRAKELEKAIEEFDVYTEIFSKVEGCGPAIAARVISSVMDIRRFSSDSKLKAFCGVHVGEGGKFVRRRRGAVANWSPDARQGLYLLADQFNRRPNSIWGKKLLEYKMKFREKHPEEVVDGKKRYSKGHIHKMAMWRTITKFVEWLYREWSRLERAQASASVPATEQKKMAAAGG